MAKRVSSAAVGVFVIGSVALMMTAIVLLGSGRLFRKEHGFICFFKGSLNGLKVGAPVKVRGVEIGSVAKILLRLPPGDGMLRHNQLISSLPVIIDVDESQLKRQGGTSEVLRPEELDALIKGGLRAQLSTESLLTGLLYIDLDLHPGSPLNLQIEPGSGRYPEIPTIPTDLEQVQETAMRALARLDKVDFEALINSITGAANAADKVMSSPDLRATMISLRDTAAHLDEVVIAVQQQLATLNAKTDPLIASMKKTSDDADATLLQAKATIADLQTTIAPDSTLRYRLDTTLDNMSEASTAIRQLADFLHRNPSAVVRGRYVPDNH
jgi:phospholipid/cholesterol/gamma-HCH transport system substrate-binding protein